MVDVDSHSTQRDLVPEIAAELRDAGFEGVAEIGHGGFGVVYRCAQPRLDRTVAVKVLTADLDPDNLGRFLREQHAIGRHVVQRGSSAGTTSTLSGAAVFVAHLSPEDKSVVEVIG